MLYGSQIVDVIYFLLLWFYIRAHNNCRCCILSVTAVCQFLYIKDYDDDGGGLWYHKQAPEMGAIFLKSIYDTCITDLRDESRDSRCSFPVTSSSYSSSITRAGRGFSVFWISGYINGTTHVHGRLIYIDCVESIHV